MAAFKKILYQTAHHPPSRYLVSILRRRFSTEPLAGDSGTSTQTNDNLRKALPIEPVSYQLKPKPPPSEENAQESQPERRGLPQENQGPRVQESRSWSRDEMRYIKDAPVINPVSYASRVAPLPEDRARVGEEEKENQDEQMKRERRIIQNDRRREFLRYARPEPEEDLPFPKLIKVENTDQSSKKKGKSIYDLKEAIQLAKSNATKKFDETLEAHVKMTPELRRTDLGVKSRPVIVVVGGFTSCHGIHEKKLSGFVRLPHGFGKTYRVAVFAEGASADEAREAGADIVGGPELVDDIRTGQVKVDFDKCISTSSMMEHVKKLSRNLKQLMPDKKKGTLTNDIAQAVKEAKEQSVLFKKDKSAIVHVGLGKASFSDDALRENIGAFVNALLLAKPVGLKKSSKYAGYVDSFHICSTMGPSFPISIQSLSMAADRYNRLKLQ